MSKSRIFLFFCLSFIFGVFIQSVFSPPRMLWPGILILGIISAAIFWARNKKMVVVGFCLIILVGGAWRQLLASDVNNLVQQFNDKGKIAMIGLVAEEPDIRSDNVKYAVEVTGLKPIGFVQEINGELGKILIVARKYPVYQYGDEIKISGKLQTPKTSEDFDYQKYLAKDDIYSIVYWPETELAAQGRGNPVMAGLLFAKNKFKESVNKILVEPQASFLAGLLLGEKRGLPPAVMDSFSRTGTTHIVALSGYNITIIAWALMGLFNFFMMHRRWSFWLSAAAIVLFVLMTGAAASVVRAAVMGILVLIARQAGRLYQIRNALVFAGAVMIYINPKVLVWDLGFQLSFAATLGLIYLSPIFQRWLGAEEERDITSVSADKNILGKGVKAVKIILAATLAAQIAVLPLLVINFGQLSLISPLANILILPVIPFTMLAGLLAGLGGLIFLPFGKILAWLAWLFLSYEIKVAELLAKIPLAAVSFDWTWLGGAIYYAILIGFVWRFNKNQKTLIERIRV